MKKRTLHYRFNRIVSYRIELQRFYCFPLNFSMEMNIKYITHLYSNNIGNILTMLNLKMDGEEQRNNTDMVPLSDCYMCYCTSKYCTHMFRI